MYHVPSTKYQVPCTKYQVRCAKRGFEILWVMMGRGEKIYDAFLVSDFKEWSLKKNVQNIG